MSVLRDHSGRSSRRSGWAVVTLSAALCTLGWAAEATEGVTAPAVPVPAPLLQQLASGDSAERARAVRALPSYGESAVAPLFARLEDEAPEVRFAAVGALTNLEGVDIVPDLLAALPQADERMQPRLYFLLAQRGDRRAWEAFLAGLEHENTLVRQAAAQGIARVVLPGDEPALAAALSSDKPAVAMRVADALQTLCTPSATDVLASLLEREDATLRQYGAQGLSECNRPEAVAHLLAHVDDPSPEVRALVYYGISQHGDATAFDVLAAGAQDTDTYVRKECVWGLGRIGDARGLALLQDTLRTDDMPAVRRNAAEALGALGDPAAVPDLRRATTDPNAAVCLLAAEALLRLGDRSGMPILIENLRHPNRHHRRIALRGLSLYSGELYGADADAWAEWWAAQAPGNPATPPEVP